MSREIRKEHLDFLMIEEAKGTEYHNPEDVWKDMKSEAKIDRECMWVLHMNGQNKIIKKELVAMGKGNAAFITPREVFRRAIIEGSINIILVHNHPGGDPTSSDADIETCKTIKEAGKLLGMPLTDFFVIAQSGYTSFADKGIGGF
ncbi:MAG: JAB domain-containing protein [Proteobacteria bacterium]|nr:JAB domain-containing protein [Pseudomonadota bacterium]